MKVYRMMMTMDVQRSKIVKFPNKRTPSVFLTNVKNQEIERLLKFTGEFEIWWNYKCTQVLMTASSLLGLWHIKQTWGCHSIMEALQVTKTHSQNNSPNFFLSCLHPISSIHNFQLPSHNYFWEFAEENWYELMSIPHGFHLDHAILFFAAADASSCLFSWSISRLCLRVRHQLTMFLLHMAFPNVYLMLPLF